MEALRVLSYGEIGMYGNYYRILDIKGSAKHQSLNFHEVFFPIL